MVKVRFAPSPTGYLHIGGARTALFNWMYAKSQGGRFVLRIEDTDRERSKKEYLEEILDSMRWLKLDWDEEYQQSGRFDIYRQHAEELLKQGTAYKDGEAVILKMVQTQVKIFDLIRGEIQFETKTLKDQVLLKSDGSAAYNFACVIDDALMEISHVIRGEDHISNTPKQIMIYQALGFKAPKFAHLPLILAEEGGRLSKRAGAVAVSDYRKMGFLPQALVNYLMLLGWSPGNNQEIVDIDSAIKKFSIKKVNKAGAAFSMEKLKWINAQYIKKTDTPVLAEMLIPYLKEAGYISENFDGNHFKKVVELFKGRLNVLTDFLDWADFIFLDEPKMDQEAKTKYLSQDRSKEFQLLCERLGEIKTFDTASTEEAFRTLVGELGIKASDLVHPVRVALTGKSVGPGLFDTMVILGKDITIRRLKEAAV